MESGSSEPLITDIRLSPEKPIFGAYEISETRSDQDFETTTYWSPSLTRFEFEMKKISLKTVHEPSSTTLFDRSITSSLNRISEGSKDLSLFGDVKPIDEVRLHIESKSQLETPLSQMYASVAEERDVLDRVTRRYAFCEFYWLLPPDTFIQVWKNIKEAQNASFTFVACHPAMHTEFHPNSDRHEPIKVLSQNQLVEGDNKNTDLRRTDDYWLNYEKLSQNEFAEFSLEINEAKSL